jgi:hypothetical protein
MMAVKRSPEIAAAIIDESPEYLLDEAAHGRAPQPAKGGIDDAQLRLYADVRRHGPIRAWTATRYGHVTITLDLSAAAAEAQLRQQNLLKKATRDAKAERKRTEAAADAVLVEWAKHGAPAVVRLTRTQRELLPLWRIEGAPSRDAQKLFGIASFDGTVYSSIRALRRKALEWRGGAH